MASVLIIDDDKALCRMFSSHLREGGHRVSSANTLKDGLRRVRSRSFDVVFLDVYLPDGNGLEALPRIKEAASLPK